jgi:hypothetical protein
MKFSEFPNGEVEVFGGQRITFTDPDKIIDAAPLPAMLLDDPERVALCRVAVRIELDPGDLEKLTAGAPIYLIQYGGCIPLCVDIPFEVGKLGSAPPLPEVTP